MKFAILALSAAALVSALPGHGDGGSVSNTWNKKESKCNVGSLQCCTCLTLYPRLSTLLIQCRQQRPERQVQRGPKANWPRWCRPQWRYRYRRIGLQPDQRHWRRWQQLVGFVFVTGLYHVSHSTLCSAAQPACCKGNTFSEFISHLIPSALLIISEEGLVTVGCSPVNANL